MEVEKNLSENSKDLWVALNPHRRERNPTTQWGSLEPLETMPSPCPLGTCKHIFKHKDDCPAPLPLTIRSLCYCAHWKIPLLRHLLSLSASASRPHVEASDWWNPCHMLHLCCKKVWTHRWSFYCRRAGFIT